MYRNGDQPSVKHLIGYIPGIICTYLGDIHADWVYLVYWRVQSMGYILKGGKVSHEKNEGLRYRKMFVSGIVESDSHA